MKIQRKLSSFFIIVFCLFLMAGVEIPLSVQAQTQIHKLSEQQLKSTIHGIINWKKIDNGSTINDYFINSTFLELAGTTPGDWFPIGIGRYGYPDDYQAYRAVIADKITARYKTRGKLHNVKSTEWHRISLAVLAMGGNPMSIGKDVNGKPINLIADGTYDRGKTMSLGRQGINGWIWGLITLDAKRYKIPTGSFYSRDDLITQILRQQLTDGGFALFGKVSDPDITAMALQALAPYYNNDKVYTYRQKINKQNVSRTVKQVIDESLAWLSSTQLKDGDFASWGTENVESTCQVIVALCSLGINPETDSRFIKNGKNLIDGILKYRMPDGGFIHAKSYDPDNPTSLPDKSNSMASEQTLYTLVSLYRFRHNMRSLYDFRPEWSSSLRTQMDNVIRNIDALSSNSSSKSVKEVFNAYKAIPIGERSYIFNYSKLAQAMKNTDVMDDSEDITKIPDGSTITENGMTTNESKSSGDVISSETRENTDTNMTTPSVSDDSIPLPEENSDSVLLYFSIFDRQAVKELPDKLTTEQYVLVTKLLDKLNNSDDFEGKDEYMEKLTKSKASITAIQKEIDSINEDILNNLYPFDSLSLKDKNKVDKIVVRYNELSEYDKKKINRWEDVIKAKTKIDNLLRGIIITMVLVIVAAVITIIVVIRIKKRRKKKILEMEELASQFEDEDEA